MIVNLRFFLYRLQFDSSELLRRSRSVLTNHQEEKCRINNTTYDLPLTFPLTYVPRVEPRQSSQLLAARHTTDQSSIWRVAVASRFADIACGRAVPSEKNRPVRDRPLTVCDRHSRDTRSVMRGPRDVMTTGQVRRRRKLRRGRCI